MKVNSLVERNKVMELIIMKMAANMKENGKKMKKMDKVF